MNSIARNVFILRWYNRCLALGYLGLAVSLAAEPAVFTIVPAESTITLSGLVVDNRIEQQGPGSLTTRFFGTINADIPGPTIPFTGGKVLNAGPAGFAIQFTGGNLIQAENSGSWQPLTNGAAGSAPANFGGTATIKVGFFPVTANGAFRNIQLELISESLAITNGQFSSTSLAFAFPTNSTASFDYNAAGVLSGSQPLAGYSTNQLTPVGTIATSGNTQTLTLPLAATYPFKVIVDNDSEITLQGQLVATRTLPEAVPSIQSITLSNQLVTLHWASLPGQFFQVESTTDFKTWNLRETNLIAAGTQVNWSTNAAQTREFFRLKQ